jgi:ATP-dependent protease HslVU (ClpYQ) ATPase subunit
MKTQIINAITKETEVREMTSEEETLHNQLIAETKTTEDKNKEKEQAIQNKKTSGRQKLKDLGLDDDEIKALMGA